jgi:hypothetical protein
MHASEQKNGGKKTQAEYAVLSENFERMEVSDLVKPGRFQVFSGGEILDSFVENSQNPNNPAGSPGPALLSSLCLPLISATCVPP